MFYRSINGLRVAAPPEEPKPLLPPARLRLAMASISL